MQGRQDQQLSTTRADHVPGLVLSTRDLVATKQYDPCSLGVCFPAMETKVEKIISRMRDGQLGVMNVPKEKHGIARTI